MTERGSSRRGEERGLLQEPRGPGLLLLLPPFLLLLLLLLPPPPPPPAAACRRQWVLTLLGRPSEVNSCEEARGHCPLLQRKPSASLPNPSPGQEGQAGDEVYSPGGVAGRLGQGLGSPLRRLISMCCTPAGTRLPSPWASTGGGSSGGAGQQAQLSCSPASSQRPWAAQGEALAHRTSCLLGQRLPGWGSGRGRPRAWLTWEGHECGGGAVS